MAEAKPAASRSAICHPLSAICLMHKRILVTLAIAVALTRLLAIAHSLNDWDEALFSLGVAEYDVDQHRPHPPGYPLFVAAAKAVHLTGVNEFRSLQVIVVLGAILLFPALVLFALELGFDFAAAISGALIFAFLPNVWIYSGTGFSDIPSLTLAFTACWLLLRGRRERRAYILGAIVLGIAAGFRLPNLLIGMFPALLATVHRLRARDFRGVAIAIALGGAITGGSYYGAVLASGTLQDYETILASQREYVRTVDSWHNPNRMPLARAAKKFFIRPIEQKQFMRGLSLLACAGILAALAQRRWMLLFTLLIFLPVMITSWLNLDIEAVGRYAMAYLAVHALFAAYFLRVVGRKPLPIAVLTSIVVLVFAVWTWPAVRLQRTKDAPVAAALHWIRTKVPNQTAVYVQGKLGPHARYLLADRPFSFYEEDDRVSQVTEDSWAVAPRIVEGANETFTWPRTNPIWKIIRRRNFEISIIRMNSLVQFGDGWYAPEASGGGGIFRWMGHEATAILPAVRGNGRLSARLYVPVDTIAPPTIEFWVNGALVERFVGAEAFMDKSWVVASRADQPNELRIKTSGVAIPARVNGSDDTRQLGLRIDSLSWMPIR
jgi:hypothetical protein